MAKATTRTMSAQHKAALAEGRSEGRAVKNYLEALQQNRPRRGRRRTPDSIKKRLAAIDAEFGDGSALQQLQLVQERMDLQKELEAMDTKVDLSALEADFVKTAAKYAAAQGHLLRGVARARRPGRRAQESGDLEGFVSSAMRVTPEQEASSDSSRTTPSAVPRRASLARSGCGMRPTTLPASLLMPAMSSRLPLGLST